MVRPSSIAASQGPDHDSSRRISRLQIDLSHLAPFGPAMRAEIKKAAASAPASSAVTSASTRRARTMPVRGTRLPRPTRTSSKASAARARAPSSRAMRTFGDVAVNAAMVMTNNRYWTRTKDWFASMQCPAGQRLSSVQRAGRRSGATLFLPDRHGLLRLEEPEVRVFREDRRPDRLRVYRRYRRADLRLPLER